MGREERLRASVEVLTVLFEGAEGSAAAALHRELRLTLAELELLGKGSGVSGVGLLSGRDEVGERRGAKRSGGVSRSSKAAKRK